MSKIVTTDKRVLKDDVWHDDKGPIVGTPADWAEPMTDAEITGAALSDPDAQPLSPDRLAKMRPVPLARRVRWKLGLTQADFADRFHIPIGTLRDWEQARVVPDAAAQAYLVVIAQLPQETARVLAETADT
jgi:putative transcriptional regulator